jgi:hypothetical protein
MKHPLPKGVLIDEEDLHLLENYNKWRIDKLGYVVTQKEWKAINGVRQRKAFKLHRAILGVTDRKLEVDHINHNPLDNRKSNLRICSRIENGSNLSIKKNNTSGFPGVSWSKERKKWVAGIMVKYRMVALGRYDTIEEAISVRLFAEDHYFGEFAPNV